MNPGPPAPKAGIIPLDQTALLSTHMITIFIFTHANSSHFHEIPKFEKLFILKVIQFMKVKHFIGIKYLKLNPSSV